MIRRSRALVTMSAIASCIAVLTGGDVSAKELEVQGHASVPLTDGKPQDVKAKATIAAKRNGVIAAIDTILGPDASLNPKVAPKVDAVVAQVPDSAIVDRKATRVENNFVVELRIVLDDKSFRTLLSDQGIAINTAAVRGASLMAIMDEFITNPRNLKAPLEEMEEFNSSVGASYSDTSSASASHDSASSDSSRSRSRAGVNTIYGSGHGENHEDSSSASRSSGSATVQNDVKAEVHDDVHYRRIVKYQPPDNSVQKVSQTYNAFVGQLQDYDLRMIDNDLFRSRFFKAPVTLQDMTSTEWLSKYVGYARQEAKADFFMVGTSVIVDSGKNENTGEFQCSGLVTMKTYSTQSGESIASETAAETASGIDANGCAANVARKLAKVAGAHVGSRVHDYWKRRATFGRELVVNLSGHLTLPMRANFSKAVKSLAGVEGVQQRTSTESGMELVVTYKGSDPFDQALYESLSANPLFSSLDAHNDGTHFQFCMGPCASAGK